MTDIEIVVASNLVQFCVVAIPLAYCLWAQRS